MNNPFYDFFITLFFGILIIGGLVILSHVSAAFRCESKAEKMGLEHDYGIVQGCMVKAKNGWIPMEAYRVIE